VTSYCLAAWIFPIISPFRLLLMQLPLKTEMSSLKMPRTAMSQFVREDTGARNTTTELNVQK
jgi:hypothetical protein